MKKIKYIFVLLLLLLTSGCTVDYNIELTDELVKEIVTITEDSNKISDNILYTGTLTYNEAISNLYKIPQPVYKNSNIHPYDEMAIVDGVDYYSKEIINEAYKYGITGKFNHSLSNYKDSEIISKCYKNITMIENNDSKVLSTSREFLCFEQYKSLEEVNITITVNDKQYNVKNHNADSVEKNQYIWQINRNNYVDKSVVIEFSNIKKEVVKYDNAMTILIGCVCFIIVAGGIIYIIGKRNNLKKNKI